MKIKLTKTLLFEPSKHSIVLYIAGILLEIPLAFLIFNDIRLFVIFILIWTLFFIWNDITYYPYDVKRE